MRRIGRRALLVAALAISGCGETVQTIPGSKERKIDSVSWQIKDNGYLAHGWTPGSEASWDAQLKKRAQAQNDYTTTK